MKSSIEHWVFNLIFKGAFRSFKGGLSQKNASSKRFWITTPCLVVLNPANNVMLAQSFEVCSNHR
jgi:hypothetical protein